MSDNVQKICQRFLKNQTPMSWLIVGGKGLGKKELVQNVALQLLGEKGMSSCFKVLECGLTEEAKKKIQKDILEGKAVEEASEDDKKSEITVEDMRGAINFLSLKTTLPCKILVISLAEQMNINAQNALLKTLEEPFDKTLIFLAVGKSGKVVADDFITLSKIYLHPLSKDQMIQQIQTKYPQEENAQWIADIAQGLPGVAEEICVHDGLKLYTQLNSFFVPIQKLDITQVLTFAQETAKDSHLYHLAQFFILNFLHSQALNSPLSLGQRWTKMHAWVESLIRKTDSLYLDKAQVLLDIILKIAEQIK